MEKYDIYKDVAKRTNGDIYIGVVGPVRTGKSTFVTKFTENLILPNISNKFNKQVAIDEMPQSADGKTVMTTEPKFIPATAVKIQLKNRITAKVRLVDCVGYLVDGAIGHTEDGKPRLVKTPWSENEMPFEDAAELGTRKVINEYSTIGIVVTTDGSFGEIPRENYISAEERVIGELKEQNKPFVIVLNVADTNDKKSINLKNELENKYKTPVVICNVKNLTTDDITEILGRVLYEFPIKCIKINLPDWMKALPSDNSVIKGISEKIKESSKKTSKMKDFAVISETEDLGDKISKPKMEEVNLGDGTTTYLIDVKKELFYEILSEESGDSIKDDYELMCYIKSLSEAKKEYSKIKTALKQAKDSGYGIVEPAVSEMKLSEPESFKKGSNYGVKIKATAPSLHIMKVDVSAEVNPIVGSEKQGEDFVNSIIKDYGENPESILSTKMFGKSIAELMGESLTGKSKQIPVDAQDKMCKTIGKIVNEGDGGVICILL